MRSNAELADIVASIPISEIHGTGTIDRGLRDAIVKALRKDGVVTVTETVVEPPPAPPPPAPRTRPKVATKKK